MIDLPEVNEGDLVSAAAYNALVAEVRRLGKLQVIAPLQLHDDGAGAALALMGPLEEIWSYKKTSNCVEPGTYHATGYRANFLSVQCANADLNILDSFDAGVDILLVNSEENGLNPAHWLEDNSVGYGARRGTDSAGLPIIVTQGGRYRTSGGATIGESGMKDGLTGSADGAFWQRDSSDAPVERWVVTGFRDYPGSPGNCPADPPKLYGYKRLETVDAGGRVSAMTTETEFTIATGCCPTAYSISSPTFASETEAAAAATTMNRIMSQSLA